MKKFLWDGTLLVHIDTNGNMKPTPTCGKTTKTAGHPICSTD